MKFRLLGDHVTAEQQLIPEGTEVGDDTPWPWRDRKGDPLPVTDTMEGLDDEGRQMVNELYQSLHGKDAYWEEPAEAREAHEKQAEEQQKLDENSEPVSDQQKRERAWEKAGDEDRRKIADMAPTVTPHSGPAPLSTPPGPGRQPSHTATASPTTGGTNRPSPGPATPQPPKADEVRPKKPNEEQYPKG